MTLHCGINMIEIVLSRYITGFWYAGYLLGVYFALRRSSNRLVCRLKRRALTWNSPLGSGAIRCITRRRLLGSICILSSDCLLAMSTVQVLCRISKSPLWHAIESLRRAACWRKVVICMPVLLLLRHSHRT